MKGCLWGVKNEKNLFAENFGEVFKDQHLACFYGFFAKIG